jgi:NTP pyrophosphatase (non-canonical NTP hydrolase)
MLTFREYQNKSADTAIYPGRGTVHGLMYCALGLGESGEVQGKVKKIFRDDNGVLTETKREAIKAELSDLLWYVANTAAEINVALEDIAQYNLDKLASRKERGVLGGSGDTR